MKQRQIRVAPLVYWLARVSPALFRVARPPWQMLKRALRLNPGAEKRRAMRYYAEAVRLARAYEPDGRSALDVGAHDTVLSRLPSFRRRVALDLKYVPPLAGIEVVLLDFMQYEPPIYFDLVLCLEVLEHLDDPRAFAAKLLRTGRTVIVSVPYKWPHGACPGHKQDPVDERKLESWTQCEPLETSIVDDGSERLFAVYRRPNGDPDVLQRGVGVDRRRRTSP